jgi:peptide/nickel transport system substrate-binding protein
MAVTPQDTLVIAQNLDGMITCDPAEAYENVTYQILAQVYDKIMLYEPDSPSMIGNGVIESWRVSEDGKRLIFQMRPGLKFHSGNSLTAQDVVFSLQRGVILNKAPAFIMTQFGFSKDNAKQRITANSAEMFTLELAEKMSPSFVINALSTMMASVVDQKTALAHEENGDLGNAWLRTHSAASGPYELVSWQPNDSVVLKAFDGYRLGAPKLKRIVFRHAVDPGAQQLLLEHGDADIARNLEPAQLEALERNPQTRVGHAQKGIILYMAMNQKIPALRNPKVWEALRYLIDYEGIASSIGRGQLQVHQSFWPAGAWASLNTTPYHLDVAKAKGLLTEAGFASGLALKLDAPNSPPYDLLAQAIQGTMGEAGVNIFIAVGDTKQVATKYRAREHELVLTSWGPDFLDPEANAGSFAWNPDNSDTAPYKPLAWRNVWDIPQLTQRVNALMLETDAARREQGYLAIEKLLQDSSPYVFLFQLVDTWASRPSVTGIIEGLLGDQIFYFKTTK